MKVRQAASSDLPAASLAFAMVVAIGSAALALTAAGCSTLGNPQTSMEGGGGPGAGPGVSFEVVNEQRTEVEIWALADMERQHLGMVRAFDRNTFFIRMDRIRTIRLEFRFFGGPTCVTGEEPLTPGEAVSYTIPLDINRFDAICRVDG